MADDKKPLGPFWATVKLPVKDAENTGPHPWEPEYGGEMPLVEHRHGNWKPAGFAVLGERVVVSKEPAHDVYTVKNGKFTCLRDAGADGSAPHLHDGEEIIEKQTWVERWWVYGPRGYVAVMNTAAAKKYLAADRKCGATVPAVAEYNERRRAYEFEISR